MVATGRRSLGVMATSVAAATTSGSMPEDAKSKSTTAVVAGTRSSESLTVASRPVSSCSSSDATRKPERVRLATSCSASRSYETATARSTSCVNRGIVRADTARPPMTAHLADVARRRAAASWSTCSGSITAGGAASGPVRRRRHQTRRLDGAGAVLPRAHQSRRRSRQGIAGRGPVASCPVRTAGG